MSDGNWWCKGRWLAVKVKNAVEVDGSEVDVDDKSLNEETLE